MLYVINIGYEIVNAKFFKILDKNALRVTASVIVKICKYKSA